MTPIHIHTCQTTDTHSHSQMHTHKKMNNNQKVPEFSSRTAATLAIISIWTQVLQFINCT